jgi:hypothetical protein
MSGKEFEKSANDKISASTNFFMRMFQTYNTDEGAELFNKAGNSYVTENNLHDAVRCYIRAHEEYSKSDHCGHYAIKNLSLAVKYAQEINEFKSCDIIEKIKIIAKIQGQNGNLKEMNDRYVEISKIYENENDLENAISILNKCTILNKLWDDDIEKRRAELLIKQNKIIEAGNIYEKLAYKILKREPALYIYETIKKCMVLSILCSFAVNDLVSANEKYVKTCEVIATFEISYEGKFIKNIYDSIDTQDINKFEFSCIEREKMLKMDNVFVNLLTLAKKYIFIDQDNDKNMENDTNGINEYDESEFC